MPQPSRQPRQRQPLLFLVLFFRGRGSSGVGVGEQSGVRGSSISVVVVASRQARPPQAPVLWGHMTKTTHSDLKRRRKHERSAYLRVAWQLNRQVAVCHQQHQFLDQVLAQASPLRYQRREQRLGHADPSRRDEILDHKNEKKRSWRRGRVVVELRENIILCFVKRPLLPPRRPRFLVVIIGLSSQPFKLSELQEKHLIA
jgi:hypothetical protein